MRQHHSFGFRRAAGGIQDQPRAFDIDVCPRLLQLLVRDQAARTQEGCPIERAWQMRFRQELRRLERVMLMLMNQAFRRGYKAGIRKARAK